MKKPTIILLFIAFTTIAKAQLPSVKTDTITHIPKNIQPDNASDQTSPNIDTAQIYKNIDIAPQTPDGTTKLYAFIKKISNCLKIFPRAQLLFSLLLK